MSNTTFPYKLYKHVFPCSRPHPGVISCLYPRVVHNVMLAQEELMIAACSLTKAKRILEFCDDGTYDQVIGSLEYLREHVRSVWRSIDGIDSYNL